MYTCANCKILACASGRKENLPKNCPMKQEKKMEEALAEYGMEDNHRFYITSSSIEAEGYCRWPRLKETLEFCRQMRYQKIGIAFCKGLKKEAHIVANFFRKQGFEVISVICKSGGYPKESVGIPKVHKINPEKFEAMCNPVAQALLLNEQGTDFNIAIGLCVGHDSMFYKYSEAPVTTLVAKDRVLAHNPCGAIYCSEGYYKNLL